MYTQLSPGQGMSADVAIVGAGVSGCAIARVLSAYKLDVILIDKEADVCFGTSKANSGIVHGGFHHNKKYLKTRLEIEGNLMFDRLHRELDFPFERRGILVAAMHEDELKHVEYLYQQGVDNGAIGIEMCSRSRMLELDPQLHSDCVGGLHAPGGGIIEPYRYGFSLAESAMKNGVEIVVNFPVARAEHSTAKGPNGQTTTLFAKNGTKVSAKWIINAAGLFADDLSRILGAEDFTITPRKGEYYLLDKLTRGAPRKVLFPVPSSISKGMLVIPTVEGTVLVGPTAEDILDKEDTATSGTMLDSIFDSARRLVPAIAMNDVITSFSGLRPAMDSGDFYIEPSKIQSNLIQVAGIQSPGLTASPAIGEYVKNLLKKQGCILEEKPDFDPFLERIPHLRDKTSFQSEELNQHDPGYSRIVCRCEKVSEAEIRSAVKAGHHTLDGIKFAARAGAGRCQGGFCTHRTIQIIHEETGIPLSHISKNGPGSEMFALPVGPPALLGTSPPAPKVSELEVSAPNAADQPGKSNQGGQA